MDRISRVVVNIIFFIQILLVFLLFVEDRIKLPAIVQVAGRMHPLMLHIPIGAIILVLMLILLQKHFNPADSHRVITVGLLLSSLSASLAALFGFFLSLQGDYGGDALMRHKISGVVLSWMCYFLVLLQQSSLKRSVFLGLGGISLAALIFAGHTGSILTHGENFLLEPMVGPPAILTAENASVYDYAIAPILEKKCYTCHNEAKAKGKLVMTDIARFKAGGEHGKEWVEGKPEESRIIKSFYLPLKSDEHMPPDGKPQLTPIEIATLKAWVKSGADFTRKLEQFPKDDSLKIVVAALISKAPVEETERIYAFESVSEDVIEKMNTPFVSVSAIYQNSPALQAEFYVRKAFDVKSLEALTVIKNQLVSLSLSKMPVDNKGISAVSGFKNLEVLNLNFTNISGEGLKQLESLKNLKLLSLSGTTVSAKDLGPILKLPNLSELYLWSTKVNESQRDSLTKLYPTMAIALSQFRDESVLTLSRPMLVNEGVIRPDEDVLFKHPMPGVSIRYTLDGSNPDSLNGTVYDKPFHFKETTTVRAIGCKDGWYCSDAVEVICFIKGITPDHVELLTHPDPSYPGEGVQSLTDGRKGVADVLKEPSWLGFRKIPFSVGFSFDAKVPTIKNIVISFARNVGAYSVPPKEIEVWAGNEKDKLRLIRKVEPPQPTGYGPVKVDALSIPLEAVTYKYYKIVATQVPALPKWHSGKGERGWVFIDEMFIYE
ncbi:MAG: FN3 associated domain-containing protein [Chryseolinea sp.]